MNDVLQKIVDKVDSCIGKDDFLDVLFGDHKAKALNGWPVVLFGAGGLGAEMAYTLRVWGVTPVCFCDNNSSKQGRMVSDLPIITFEDLKNNHTDSLIILSLDKHLDAVAKQLEANDFSSENILRKELDSDSSLIAMYSMVGSKALFVHYKECAKPKSILEKLMEMEANVEKAYHSYSDQKSKDLFVSKLAVFAANMHFNMFKEFMLMFSEPIHKFGMLNYEGTSEDYFYFNNDILSVSEDEIYMDVGAYDGDTIETFVDACKNAGVKYKHIYGIEPDPDCFDKLETNVKSLADVSIHKIGLWSESTTLEFIPSDEAIHDQAGEVVSQGSVKIDALSLDDFLDGDSVTFLKMDPSGVVVYEVMLGAKKTLEMYAPKLALGIYHSLEEFINVPIFIKSVNPKYELFLRHNTYHLCDTDLYAYV